MPNFRGDSAAASLKRAGFLRKLRVRLDFRGDSAAASLKPRHRLGLPDRLRRISAAIPPRPH